MFKRRPSPRDDTKTRDGRSQSSAVLQQNGHRRDGSDVDADTVKNFGYGDPDVVGSSRGRAVTSPTTDFQSQKAVGGGGRGDDVESAVYVTPADTLNRGTPSSVVQPNSNPSSGSSSGASFSESFSGSRSEKRNMQLHQLTLSQMSNKKSGSDIAAPSPSPSGGNRDQRIQMVAGSDYSVPFNLLQQNDGKQQRKGRHVSDNSEFIVPISHPSPSPQSPSDRSDTTSPNSPRSNQSSEQDQPPPPPPSQQRPPDEGDYAIPWDRSRIFQNLQQRGSVSGPRRGPGRRRDLDEVGTGGGPSRSRGGSLRDQQPSPPIPLPPSRYPVGEINQVPPPPPPDDSPPPPDLPYDPNRPWRNRAVSDRVHDNSAVVMPHNRTAMLVGDDPGGRSHSMSGHGGSGRRPTPRRASTPPIVDPSIPLEDQPWYHGNLTRAEAEDKLKDQCDFSFLVRKSESCQTDFSLSIRDVTTGCIHLRMVYEDEPSPGYVLGQFSRHFEKVTDCIAFYMKQRLNIRGAEHKRLGYPVPRTHAMDRHQNSLARVGV